MSLLARFIAANQRLSQATENRLRALFKRHIQTLYKYEVAELLNRRPGQIVLDVGGAMSARSWHSSTRLADT
jgi:hypothetical protein